MKLSTGVYLAAAMPGGENPFALLKKIGYEACDDDLPCSMFTKRDSAYWGTEKEFNELFEARYRMAREAGIEIGQVHAPFPTYPFRDFTQEEIIEAIRRALVASAILHSPYLVVHPAQPHEWGDDPDPAFSKELNYKIFSALLPTAKDVGVKLALENMPSGGGHIPASTPEEWKAYVDMMDSEWFVACLDTGHANIAKYHAPMPKQYDAADYARIMGSRIKCLHVHDNDGNMDLHTMPDVLWYQPVQWTSFFQALKEIGYAGTFNMESEFSHRLPESLRFQGEQLQYDLIKVMLAEAGL